MDCNWTKQNPQMWPFELVIAWASILFSERAAQLIDNSKTLQSLFEQSLHMIERCSILWFNLNDNWSWFTMRIINKQLAYTWRENMVGLLSMDITCSKKQFSASIVQWKMWALRNTGLCSFENWRISLAMGVPQF